MTVILSAADVIARIKDQGLTPDPLRGGIGTASDFVLAGDQLKATPTAWVLPSAKRAGPDRALTGVISQHIRKQFTVLIGFARAGASGGDRLDDIEEVEEQLIDALVGWQPEGVVEPVIYAGGRLVGINTDAKQIFWGSDFAAGFYLRK